LSKHSFVFIEKMGYFTLIKLGTNLIIGLKKEQMKKDKKSLD